MNPGTAERRRTSQHMTHGAAAGAYGISTIQNLLKNLNRKEFIQKNGACTDTTNTFLSPKQPGSL